MVLMMAEYIRKNPDSPLTSKIKGCKDQTEQFALFSKSASLNSGVKVLPDVDVDISVDA